MVTEKEVIGIAALARLSLKEGEVHRFTEEFNKILGHMKQLEELDLSQVEPTSHGHVTSPAWREDQVRTALVRDQVLAQAPDRDGPYFQVPKVIA